jgi:hypothetical protein
MNTDVSLLYFHSYVCFKTVHNMLIASDHFMLAIFGHES